MSFDPRDNRNVFNRAGRVRAAAKEIAGLRAPGPGLGCACHVQPVRGPTLKGYQRVVLHGPHRLRGRGLSAAPESGTPALIPVSDRSAVAAAVKLFAMARGK